MSSLFQVQQLVAEGLLFRWLGLKFSRTSTPFLGSVVLGSLTATLATLGDVSWLLVTGAAGKIAFDLTICTASLLVHYGVGLPQCSSHQELAEESNGGSGSSLGSASKASGSRRRLQRKRRKRHKWVTPTFQIVIGRRAEERARFFQLSHGSFDHVYQITNQSQ